MWSHKIFNHAHVWIVSIKLWLEVLNVSRINIDWFNNELIWNCGRYIDYQSFIQNDRQRED